jgi:hypothetical protein
MNAFRNAALALIALATVGCAQTPENTGMGDSVRKLITEQTHDAQASERNGTTAPEGTDADRANAAVKTMRDGVTKSEGQARGITLNIGTGDSGGR